MSCTFSHFCCRDLSTDDSELTIPLLRAESSPSDFEIAIGRTAVSFALALVVHIKRGTVPEASEKPVDGEEEMVKVNKSPNEIDWTTGRWELVSEGRRHIWGGGLTAPDSWHSMSLSIKHSSYAGRDVAANLAGIDLVFDGANRRKLEDVVGDVPTTVLRWLESLGMCGESTEPSPNQGVCTSLIVVFCLPINLRNDCSG